MHNVADTTQCREYRVVKCLSEKKERSIRQTQCDWLQDAGAM